MFSGLFQNSSPFVKIIFSVFVILVGFTIFMVLGMLLSMVFFGLGIEEIGGNIDPLNPQNTPVLKFLQACFSIGLFVFPPFLIALFLHGKIAEYLKLDRIPSMYIVLLSVLLIFFSLPLVNFLVMLNGKIVFPESLKGLEDVFKNLEKDARQTTEMFLSANNLVAYFTNLLIIALIPAFGEELLFRGVFQRLFHEWLKNIHLAIFLSAFIFSALHFQFYGIIPRMLLGALFGYLFYWSGNLWLPIIAHFLNNSLAVSFYFVKGDFAQKAENIGTGNGSLLTVIFSALSVALILYMIYKLKREAPTEVPEKSNEIIG